MKALYHGCHGFAVHADGPCKGNPWNALAPFRHGQGSGIIALTPSERIPRMHVQITWSRFVPSLIGGVSFFGSHASCRKSSAFSMSVGSHASCRKSSAFSVTLGSFRGS